MKTIKLLIISFLFLVLNTSVKAQSNKINYQGLLKNSGGSVLANQTGVVGIGIRFGTAASAIVYQENHNVTTDANGVFSIQVGSGTPTTGTYDTLVWGTDLAFVTTSLDGTDLGTTELNAVPFALSSKNDVWSKTDTNISNTNPGRVGIGTTTPGAKFMVVGTTGAPTLNILHDGTTPTNPALRVNDNGRVGIGTTTPGARLMVVGEGFTNATVALNVVNNATTSLFHIKDDGNIGIGTTTPLQKLHIVGTAQANKFRLGDTGGNAVFWDIEEQANNGLTFSYPGLVGVPEKIRITGSGRFGIGTATPGAKLMVVGEGTTNATVALNIVNNATTSLFHIKDDGNIGIGTTTPTQKLDVVGNVKANSFIALLNTYPDYVFENYFEGTSKLNKTYKFKKLSEIEAFIKANNHLEGYESINNLPKEKDGSFIVDISQQSTTNQEKIEELYLHTIELNKKIEKLEKLVKQLLSERK